MELQAHRTLCVVLIVNYVSFHLNQVLFCKLGNEVAFGIYKTTANSVTEYHVVQKQGKA